MCQKPRFYIFKNGLTLTDLGQNRKLNGNKSDFKVSKTKMFLSRENRAQSDILDTLSCEVQDL